MGKKTIILAVAVALCLATAVFAVTKERTVMIETVRVGTRTIERTVTCEGVTESGDTDPVFLQTGCIIDSVNIKEGMYIKAGDVIATIDKVSTKQSGQLSQKELLTLSSMKEDVLCEYDGIVLKVNALEGVWNTSEEPIAIITPSEKIRVRIAIKEKHLSQLRVGQSVTVSGEGLCVSECKGTLTEISSAAKRSEKGGTYVEGVVELHDVDEKALCIGINVDCRIVVDTVNECVVVPYETVVRDGGDSRFIYVLAEGKAIKQPIRENGELSDGLMVDGKELVGKDIVLDPSAVAVGRRRKYVSAEED